MLTAETLAHFRANPEIFFERVLGVTSLEAHHRRMLRAIASNERTAIAACHDVGKSWTLARVVLWFLLCNPNSKVITTAPTYNQVKNILWSEIRSAHKNAKYPLGGSMNLTEWKLDEEWFAIGFTPRNELIGESGQGTQSSFQGFHAEGGLLVVFDEATGVPNAIWVMAEGLLTQAHVKFVCIANPTSRNSEFYKCFKSRDWAKVYMSCLDSPNFPANGIRTIEDLQREVAYYKTLNDDDARARLASYKAPVPYLLSLSWTIRSIVKWGWEHPLTLSKILGKFPEDIANSVVSLSNVEESQYRQTVKGEFERNILGVDVARFGGDATVFTVLDGRQQKLLKKFNKRDTNEISGEIISLARDQPQGYFDVIVVDETGLGAGVVDNLHAAQRDGTLSRLTEIRGVQFGSACLDKEDHERFVNVKARMFFLLGDDLKKSDGLVLLNEDCYAAQLPTILYRYDGKGRMYIESKEEYKKRSGQSSPDEADSLALANYGRYDEMKVGTFTPDFNRSNAAPMAGRLGDRNEW